MLWSRRTVPYELVHNAEIIIRYDPETFEAVVTKSRVVYTPCTLDDLEAAMKAQEEYEQRMKVHVEGKMSDAELGTLWNT